ncbi:MAG: preprotein translocase subunit SecG [Flavobacteriales bacterium CG_4_9_14_3_um_filter_40_17]|nr:MAG: preprotein translocase subunit SecG [Flavobacteriales bacterium CG_4_9_14_3_um_filter_40_17]
MNTFTIFMGLIVIVSFLLVLVIMVQNPKGGGLSSSFGGGSQSIGGVQKTNDFLDKSTWTLATVLVALILVSGLAINKTGGSASSKALEGAPDVEQTIPAAKDQNNTEIPVNGQTDKDK